MTFAEIIALLSSNKYLGQLRKLIESGRGTFADTFRYTDKSADLLGDLFSESVLDMPDEERITSCVELLRDRHKDINGLFDIAQRSLDKKAGLSIAPQHVPFDEERAKQIGTSLTDKTVPEATIQRRAKSATANATRSMHDDCIEANAKFRAKAGLQCYITRTTDGSCCKWCTQMAGRYEYGSEPKNVYRRHDNCGCMVTYENGRKRQNVWSKKTWKVPADDAGAPPPVVFTQEQAAAAGAPPPKSFTKEEAQRLNSANVKKNSAKADSVHNSSIDNSEISDIISLRDDNSLYKPVTQEAIDRVPKLDIFDDDEMNKRHQQAAKDLLTEVKKREDVPVGTEFSIRYDKDMKPLKDEVYRQGKIGSVKLDDMDIPYHAFHNHGSNQTLSYNDLRKFANSENMLSLTAQGNLGSTFSIVSSDNADKIGYRTFLNIVGDEKIYEIKGVSISLSFLSDSANKDKVKDLISLLTPNQRGDLSKAIISQSDKCLNGGVDYGIKYYKAKLAE